MADCDYNCVDLPYHEKVQCGNYKKGSIDAIGILNCGHEITDFSLAAQYTSAITAGDLRIIKGIKGELPDPSPVEGENTVGSEANILDGFDNVLNWLDFNVNSANDDFYEKLNQRSAYVILFNKEENEVRVIERKTRFTALPANNPQSPTEKQRYSVVAKWKSNVDQFPVAYTAPADIFE
jgi:hypothetical protein